MPDILIRDVPEDIANWLTVKAAESGIDRMAYIRNLLTQHASGPVVKERYAYRVYTTSGARGKITRHSDHPNGTGSGFSGFNQEEADAMRRAEDFIRRNEVGDREKAVALLQATFEEVMETPV